MPATEPPAGRTRADESAESTVETKSSSAFFAAASLSFLSGAAGLAHQVLWTRRLVDVLGATSLTFSKVVGAFFLGLALGGWIASRFQSHPRPWLAVAVAEFLTAILALPVLWIPQAFQVAAPSLVGSDVLRFLLPLFFVVPPALCMGLVLPWLVRVLDPKLASRHAVFVYALNILGGICGIVLLLLYALPSLGTVRSGLLTISLNFAIAVVALFMSKNQSAANPVCSSAFRRSRVERPEDRTTSTKSPSKVFALAFVSGFLVLASEVVLQHQFAQITINSFFSNASVLALVLLGLGLSALLLPIYQRAIPIPNQLPLVLAAAAIAFAAQPVILLAFRPGLATLPYELTAPQYALQLAGIGLAGILPLFVTAGLIFPLILGTFLDSTRRVQTIGLLLAWNGLGGWFGAEITQYLLAPSFGLWLSMILLACGYALAGILLAPSARLALAVILVGIVAPLGYLARSLPQTALSPGERIAELKVSPEGVVAVSETAPGDWRILFNNSYTLGGSTAQFNQERQAHLPLLLHGTAKSVALLGVATGSTTAGAATHPYLERIDAFELSPVVLDFARTHFAPFNRNVFRDPRVHFFAEDARWAIAGRAGRYDVVIGDLFLPWRTGEGRLFTLEHFQNVRRSLAANGIFCQWLPMFQLTRAQFESIARTFQIVFPEVFLIRGDFYAELPILGLVGGRTIEQIDWAAAESAASQLRSVAGQDHMYHVQDALARHKEGLAMMLIGQLPHFQGASVNALDNGWLEWNAGQNIIGLRQPWFIGVPLAEFVREVHRASVPKVSENLRAAHESGQFFLTLEIAAKVEAPVLPNLKAQIPLRLPPPLREDTTINRLQWPSRVKPFQ